ncbi:ATP-binding protein [Streptomyces sp. LARHCF249]
MRCPPRRPFALASSLQASDCPAARGARYGIDVLVHPLLPTSSSRFSVRGRYPDPRYATRGVSSRKPCRFSRIALRSVWSRKLGDMRLCASELAANAVLHGAPPGRDFGVRLVREPGRVLIEVRDSGPGLPVIQCTAPDAPAGRGLWLVREVADEFGVLDEAVGKTAWVAFEA